ncbi:T9SS type A sorting domain-containing protein [Rasiella rasia]|uniref:T9SS type A sorting domain-containing protein n=1 Tax=Rasiella rasia TaxID=2744027 RepID=A0A6G6GPH0_9FLAO|nr:T9SS type A sorting domain-containing protein [Rasiella rasia]QIE60374.1 T9SS type A sorting domain-containing protein [Rasiella rasia]
MKKIVLLFSCLFVTLISLGQGGDAMVPISWEYDIESSFVPIELPEIDFSLIRQQDSINDLDKSQPWRYGIQQEISVNLKTQGERTILDNGDKLWRIAFRSSNAVNLSVNFNKFYLPSGTHLQLYSGNHEDVSKAYTNRDNRVNQRAGTWYIEGEEIWIEYFEPAETTGIFKIEIESVIHGYRMGAISQFVEGTRGLNDSGACNYDVNCRVGDDFDGLKDNLKKSVALLNLGNGYLCSSVLVNNAEQDKTPYILTANHCLQNSNPDLWSARFNWVSPNPVCGKDENTEDLQNNFTMSGAILRANNAKSDFALVELSNEIPDTWDVAFAGWDNTDVAPIFEVGIHHPNGDIMKVCRDNTGATKENAQGTEVWLIGGLSEGTGNGWEIGTTESGSSGSPLFNQNGHVIGQLYAGLSSCNGEENNNEYDIYGRFGISWDAGTTPETRLHDWLDPLNSGATTVNTLSNILNVNDVEFVGDLQIYPNPANTFITVMNSKYPELSYGLYDVSGKKISSGSLHATANTIVVSDISEGIYFLHLVDEDSGNTITKRIVVKHS